MTLLPDGDSSVTFAPVYSPNLLTQVTVSGVSAPTATTFNQDLGSPVVAQGPDSRWYLYGINNADIFTTPGLNANSVPIGSTLLQRVSFYSNWIRNTVRAG